MTQTHSRNPRCILVIFCMVLLLAGPVHAFTADSLDITVDKSGDATAVFRYTLEGLIENAIPESVLQEQLLKGLTSSNDPPQLISMDKSSATLLLKKFADVTDVPTGTQYQTASMDFKKAEIALKNSAVSSVITADFSPAKVTVTFPDKYTKTLNSVDSLPAITHIVIDPSKAQSLGVKTTTGSIKVISSPSSVQVFVDNTYTGDAPSTFPDIAPGIHTLKFHKEGYSDVTKAVNISAGQTLQVSVFLAYHPTTTVPAPGFAGILGCLALVFCVIIRMRK
jgi:hypothetical protein